MKLLPIVLLLLVLSGSALCQKSLPPGTLPKTTVANLPTSHLSNQLFEVTNGASATDCTVGGGTTSVVCKWNGSAYAAIASGGSGSGDALVANPLSQFASTTSAQLAGVISNETGTGVVVLATGPSLTSPKIITDISDTNGNELFKVTATGSAVNELTVANAAAGAGPTLSATGADTDIDINLSPKGTGKVNLGVSGATTSYLDMLASAAPSTPASGTGTVYVDSTSKNVAVKDDAGVVKHGVKTKAVVTGDYVTGIADDGTVSTATVSGGGTTINSTDTVIPYRSNSTTFADSPLFREDANTISQRNSTTSQQFQVYATYTSGANYRRTDIASNGLFLEGAGASADNSNLYVRNIMSGSLNFGTGGANKWILGGGSTAEGDGNLVPMATYNIGSTTLPVGTLYATSLALTATVTAGGTTGAQTINKSAGAVNLAAAATSLVVTDSLVSATSIVICTVATNDSTMKSVQCVAGSGSFTIFANAAATAETRVNFWVLAPN